MDEASWCAAEKALRADYGRVELHMVRRHAAPFGFTFWISPDCQETQLYFRGQRVRGGGAAALVEYLRAVDFAAHEEYWSSISFLLERFGVRFDRQINHFVTEPGRSPSITRDGEAFVLSVWSYDDKPIYEAYERAKAAGEVVETRDEHGNRHHPFRGEAVYTRHDLHLAGGEARWEIGVTEKVEREILFRAPDEPRRRKWALAVGAVVILAMALAVWMSAR